MQDKLGFVVFESDALHVVLAAAIARGAATRAAGFFFLFFVLNSLSVYSCSSTDGRAASASKLAAFRKKSWT
jgi:hypothetical protein